MTPNSDTTPIKTAPPRATSEPAPLLLRREDGHLFLWSAPPRRAGIEAALFMVLGFAALFLAVPALGTRALQGSLVLGELGALLLALRLRLPREGQQQIAFEAGVAALFALGVSVVYAIIALAFVWNGALDSAATSFVQLLLFAAIGVAILLFHGASYLALRMLFAMLRWWNRLRQRRLLWALTHDQLVTVLVLMVVFGIAAALFVLATGLLNGVASGTFSADTLVQQLFSLSLIGAFYLAVIVLMLIGTLPLALLISFVLVRRIVRRVEQLAIATEALRRGDYAARVDVVGQDEIAQLQADFNAMASDLDASLHALHEERDRVAGLLQAQRELTASVSHELRTPVATQRSYLDAVLREDANLSPQVRAELAVVERETRRLQRLIDDLFVLSRAEMGRLALRMEPLDLGAVAERVATTLAPIGWQQGRVTIAAQIPPTRAVALADEERFEQILRNLVHNGIRHTPPGGIVAIAVTEDASHVLVQVNDTGSGIAPQDMPHIWDRFYRADAARALDQSGAGLGLALVKDLTEAMGGSVAVESTLGAGSSFTLRLPRAEVPN